MHMRYTIHVKSSQYFIPHDYHTQTLLKKLQTKSSLLSGVIGKLNITASVINAWAWQNLFILRHDSGKNKLCSPLSWKAHLLRSLSHFFAWKVTRVSDRTQSKQTRCGCRHFTVNYSTHFVLSLMNIDCVWSYAGINAQLNIRPSHKFNRYVKLNFLQTQESRHWSPLSSQVHPLQIHRVNSDDAMMITSLNHSPTSTFIESIIMSRYVTVWMLIPSSVTRTSILHSCFLSPYVQFSHHITFTFT